MTLADALLKRANGLTLVRLALASLVIILHAWVVGKFEPASLFFKAWPLGQWAVPGFFCLSGFLIAGSRMRLRFGRFMWHRTLRIFPAYWACLLVIAFVLAPLSTRVGGDWASGAALDYAWGNILLFPNQPNIPGTVGGYLWDASFWTLSYEFLAYVSAGLLLIAASRRQATCMSVVLIAALTTGNLWALKWGETANHTALVSLRLGSYFAAGMLFYFLSHRIPVRTTWAASAILMVAGAQATGLEHAIAPLPLAYLVLWLGAVIPARWSPRSDLSYGVYIYAFPVQVLLEWFLPDLTLTGHVVATLLLTLPLAWLSWHVVERPALRLKSLWTPTDRAGPPGRRSPSVQSDAATASTSG